MGEDLILYYHTKIKKKKSREKYEINPKEGKRKGEGWTRKGRK